MPKLSPWSKRSAAIGSILLVLSMFVACGDDDSDFATRPSDDSSSSVCKDCNDGSSSSVTPKSSDSETSVSSSSTKSSSSSAKSSDSVVGCKTETEDNCEYGELADDRDGQTYKTVKIGDQWWMAENLNYAYLQPTDELDSSSFCYNDSAEYCEKYGRLYLWSAAMDSAGTWSSNGKGCGYGAACSPTAPVRGVCPEGWHLPDTTEWRALFTAVGGYLTAGAKLKFTSGWNSDGNGTDDFGFSALPASRRHSDGSFVYEGYTVGFWSSVEFLNNYAFGTGMDCGNDIALLGGYVENNYGYAVRCIMDEL